MTTSRRQVLAAGILAAFLLPSAFAQPAPYPNRPVKFVVPFPPGGNLDFLARTMQPKLSEFLGQQVIVENKGGAGGIVGAEYASKQPNDGYTLFLGNTGTIGLYVSVYPKLPYDPVKDFDAVGMITANAVLTVVHPDVPAKTMQELIAYAKANPGKVNAGVAGSGSLLHFATELLKSHAGIDLVVVPYKGSGPVVTDLLGGQVQMSIDAPSVFMSHVKAGKLRALAVTGKARLPALPEVPTFEEAGLKGFDASGWQGMLVPAGTPAAIVARLSDALLKTLAVPDVRERMVAAGLEVAPSTPQQFTAHIRAEIDKWNRVAKAANLKVE
jgi:tripartite-type tricarboxylate transporter receptor subunit TctC